MPDNKKINKKVVFFSNSESHFYNHLLPIAMKASSKGYQVSLITNPGDYKAKLDRYSIEVIPINLERGSINPFQELMTLFNLFMILLRKKPDILHNFTVKPVLYGTIASIFLPGVKVVNTFLGMGYLFISHKLFYRFLRNIYCGLLSVIGFFRKIDYIVQNQDDKLLLLSKQIKNIRVQCSVGVDLRKYKKFPSPKGKVVFAMVSRMLKDKGVLEFIEAAKDLQDLNAEFWLVGEPDKQNKASLSESFLKSQKTVKYLGHIEDINSIWKKSHVAVLPSYREGLSRSLLEAGACGRVIITTDAPGGRDLVKDGEDGLLVPVASSKELATAMRRMYEDKNLREKLTLNMQKKIVQNYDAGYIAELIVNSYEE